MATPAMGRLFPTFAALGCRLVGAGGRWLKRRGRLSIRGLVALVLVVGGGLGWEIRGAREQRDAVAAIRALQGTVFYDVEWRNATPNPYRQGSWSPLQLLDGQLGEHPWLGWIVDRVGIDYFANVVEVRLIPRRIGDEPEADDATLAQIGRLHRLQGLGLNGTRITDAGLIHLRDLDRLNYLDLGNTRVTDAGLDSLVELTNLGTCFIRNSAVTPAGLGRLRRALPHVQTFR